MFLVCAFLTSPEAALGWLVAGSALAPQLGFGRTKDKKQGQLLETSENWASTSWSQVWVGKEKLMGAEGRIPASRVSQRNALSIQQMGPGTM